MDGGMDGGMKDRAEADVDRAHGAGADRGAPGGRRAESGTSARSARHLRPRRDPGNFVIVEHAAAELTEYRHLQHGSVAVTVGMQVRRGQVIGRCGSSGNAGTPHLHLGFLGSVDPIATRPMRLSRYEILRKDGTWIPGDGVPAAGVILRASAPVAEPAAASPR
jgi:murein DD-endopeptidase MepM/ murein hydrolase activator NlpD